MGALTSRQNAGVEEADVASNHVYKYPPKPGAHYFGSHFIMGGERFDTPQPEAYLFGENADLNFLGSRPTQFPYPSPQANEPTKTLKSLVNIRKESLRLARSCKPGHDVQSTFNIEFTFDSDARTSITIYYFATEEVTPNGVIYTSREPSLTSETFEYKRGVNQQFCEPSHTFDPSRYTEEDLTYNPEKEVIPVAIHCVAHDGPDETRQSHTCIAVVERHSDGTYVIKALKQKIFVDGLCYLLQEIYGIENKNLENAKSGSEVDTEDNGSECVICMCDVRDTLILPCRHLCLCNSCADSLRYQANNCPICRAPFRALLQIRALQKTSSQQIPGQEGSCENMPVGYEGVSLIEALNGPCLRPAMDTPDHEHRSSLERTPKPSKAVSSPDYTGDCSCPESKSGAGQVRMSVLLAREAEGRGTPGSGKRRPRHKDTVRTVNETSLTPHQEPPEEELDSEAEKLSPLLTSRDESKEEEEEEEEEEDKEEEAEGDMRSLGAATSPTQHEEIPLEDMAPSINQSVRESGGGMGGVGGEDSDYYTPEDPATTILSPLHDKVTPSYTV